MTGCDSPLPPNVKQNDSYLYVRNWLHLCFYAAVPKPVDMDKVMCTHYLSDHVVKIEITQQDNTSVDLNYYEVSISGASINQISNVSAVSAVSALSDNTRVIALYYPIQYTPMQINVTIVDMCNQRSQITQLSGICHSGIL